MDLSLDYIMSTEPGLAIYELLESLFSLCNLEVMVIPHLWGCSESQIRIVNKDLLSNNYVPGTVLGIRIYQTKQIKKSCLH